MGLGLAGSNQYGQREIAAEVRERMVRLAEFLPARERGLVVAVFGEGASIRSIAAIEGCAEWEIRRRLARVASLMSRAEFAFVARSGESLPVTNPGVATACFVEGLGVRAAAKREGVSMHRVRRVREQVRALAAA